MKLKKIQPSGALRCFVKYYWIYEVDQTDIPFSQLVLPFDSFELIFNLTGIPEIEIAGNSKSGGTANLYIGQFTKAFVLNYFDVHKSVGISLYPWAGDLLFDTPANTFTNCFTPFDDLERQQNLQDHMCKEQDDNELILQCENYLLGKLKTLNIDPVSSAIVNTILKNQSMQGLNNIVDNIGGSRRRIEQKFLRSTGLTIGLFQRKIRFQNAVEILLYSEDKSLTSIGLDAGYYDQSHFIREFKAFSELRPKDFLLQIKDSNSNNITKDILLFNIR
jgi:AraC-like DNA-binding protein